MSENREAEEKLNCLQISKAWLALEKRAGAAEQEAERLWAALEHLYTFPGVRELLAPKSKRLSLIGP